MTIILDKNAVDLVEPAWLQATPQRWYPIVVVGYHAPVYAFREALPAFGIEGPKVDWNTTPYQGGFSVWKLRTATANNKASCMQGYDQPATINNIMQAVEVCNT